MELKEEEQKMKKFIRMNDIDLDINTGTTMYVNIDVFKFIADEQLESVEIQIETNGESEFLEGVHTSIADHDDLRKFALNWIFKNVEITDNFIE